MCWMSLTVVVSARSKGVMMRPAIWSGGKPWYCQATPMIGMSMLGKMSTGMRNAASAPNRKMSSTATMNVYGRLSAIRTIPSMWVPECDSRGARHQRRHHPTRSRARMRILAGMRILARILGGEPADGGPIEALAALRKQAQKSIMQQASQRHGYAQTLRRGQREPDVLESEGCSEACRLELAFGDQGAVGFVYPYVEYRGGEKFHVRAPGHPGPP